MAQSETISRQQIYDFIEKHGAVTAKEVADEFHLSYTGAWNALKRLRTAGAIRRVKLIWAGRRHSITYYLGALTGTVLYYVDEMGLARRLRREISKRWIHLTPTQKTCLSRYFRNLGMSRRASDYVFAGFQNCMPAERIDEDAILTLVRRTCWKCRKVEREIIYQLARGNLTYEQLLKKINAPRKSIREALRRLRKRKIVAVLRPRR